VLGHRVRNRFTRATQELAVVFMSATVASILGRRAVPRNMARGMHVLAVCSGNTCRSPMLKAALQLELARERRFNVVVHSAGANITAATRQPASVYARRMFAGMLQHHTSTWIGERTLSSYDLVLCMTVQHRAAVLRQCEGNIPRVLVFPGGLSDPKGQNINVYEMQALQLQRWASVLLTGVLTQNSS